MLQYIIYFLTASKGIYIRGEKGWGIILIIRQRFVVYTVDEHAVMLVYIFLYFFLFFMHGTVCAPCTQIHTLIHNLALHVHYMHLIMNIIFFSVN